MHAGLTASAFLRFAQDAGLLSLDAITKPSLVIVHQRLCAQQRDKQRRGEQSSARSWARAEEGVEPVQRMRFDAFARALVSVAASAFPHLETARARIEALFAHVAAKSAAPSGREGRSL